LGQSQCHLRLVFARLKFFTLLPIAR
jgi:hypothetical protein